MALFGFLGRRAARPAGSRRVGSRPPSQWGRATLAELQQRQADAIALGNDRVARRMGRLIAERRRHNPRRPPKRSARTGRFLKR